MVRSDEVCFLKLTEYTGVANGEIAERDSTGCSLEPAESAPELDRLPLQA